MDETRARFLTAIAAKIGAERIVEVHLFSPIRQGVLETGVAVVAVEPAPASAAIAVDADTAPVEGAIEVVVEEAVDVPADGDEHVVESIDEIVAETELVVDASDEAGESSASADIDDESPYAEEGAADTAVEPDAVVTDAPIADATAEPAEAPVDAPAAVAIERHVIYTARYRLTRKGPDRGKWLFELAATADAPLATADVVARGVTMRAKDVTETERFSGEQLRALLQEPAWRTAP